MIKVCSFCANRFEAKRNDAKFCSDSCRQLDYRRRHNKPQPDFSAIGSVQPQLETKQTVVAPEKSMPAFAQFLLARQPNPEYLKVASEINNLVEKRNLLQAEKEASQTELARVIRSDPKAQTILEGMALGGVAGYALSKEEKAAKGILASIGGAVLWSMLSGDAANKRKQDRINQLKTNIENLNGQIDLISLKIPVLKYRLNQLPKTITPVNPELKPVAPLPYENRESIAKVIESLSNQKNEPKLDYLQKRTLSAKELTQKKFNTLSLKGIWSEFIGEPEFGFSASIFGSPGHGKSTFAILLAKYLSENHGKVLFNSSEEKHSKSLSDKFRRIEATSEFIKISSASNIVELTKEMERYTCPFVILDSVNYMKATPDEIENLKNKFPSVSLILIHQATKTGHQKGSNEFPHNADIVIQVIDGVARTTKNRFGIAGKELTVYTPA